MMKLLSNPLSPYGRKVKIAMAMKGLTDKIEVVAHRHQSRATTPQINSANPLAKIPALVVDGRQRDLRQPRDLRVPRQPGAVAGAVSQERAGALEDADARLRWPTASSMRRCCWSTRSASGPRRSGTRPGSSASRARSTARSISSRRQPAGLGREPGLRPPDARLRARLSRLPPRGQMARRPSQAGGLARPVRQGRAGLRGDAAEIAPSPATPAGARARNGSPRRCAHRDCGFTPTTCN